MKTFIDYVEWIWDFVGLDSWTMNRYIFFLTALFNGAIVLDFYYILKIVENPSFSVVIILFVLFEIVIDHFDKTTVGALIHAQIFIAAAILCTLIFFMLESFGLFFILFLAIAVYQYFKVRSLFVKFKKEYPRGLDTHVGDCM